MENFYPRPPRGERPVPLERGFYDLVFLSTPSSRRATLWLASASEVSLISIHALLAESDGRIRVRCLSDLHFYPRPPRGERRFLRILVHLEILISIHALLAESDQEVRQADPGVVQFLSTPSSRRAT